MANVGASTAWGLVVAASLVAGTIWLDLQEPTMRQKEDYDPTLPEVRARREAVQEEAAAAA